MADVSRLTPRPSPAHQPRTASMAPPRALADGRDGPERPDHEAHLVDCADRAAEQLPPDTRSMTGLARGAPPAGAPPRRPPPRSALGQLTSLSRVPEVARRPRGTRRHRVALGHVRRPSQGCPGRPRFQGRPKGRTKAAPKAALKPLFKAAPRPFLRSKAALKGCPKAALRQLQGCSEAALRPL